MFWRGLGSGYISRIMEKLGITRVVVYIDDILITGENEGEHLSNLKEVLKGLRQFSIKVG